MTASALQIEWPSIWIASWEHFVAKAAEILRDIPYPTNYVFRGQPDAEYGLTPSILRHFTSPTSPSRALQIEAIASDEFTTQAHLFLAPNVASRFSAVTTHLSRWAMMQHHGAPTRLLDWTASPYVAAYFAVEKEPQANGAVYVVHPELLHESYKGAPTVGTDEFDKLLVDPSAPSRVYFFRPDLRTERTVAQQGHFSVNLNVLGDHDSSLAASLSAIATAQRTLVSERWLIPPGLKPRFLQHLRVMNVAAHALFPGLDGLGRSIAELIRLQPA